MFKIMMLFFTLLLPFSLLSLNENDNETAENNDCDADLRLILNMKDEAILPRNFRIAKSPKEITSNTPSFQGLDNLNCSSSGQFSKKSLMTLMKNIPSKNITIVDLRQESHGYLDDNAVSWYGYLHNWANLEKNADQIERDQLFKLKDLVKKGKSEIFETKNSQMPSSIIVNNAYSEQQLTKSLGLNYHRLYVTDHVRPTDEIVDRFVAFVKALPNNTWLHFHCSAGKGRSTTFMSMYDMIRNSHHVKFNDILTRQHLIGGNDLQPVTDPSNWKHIHIKERLAFLHAFYDYCKENSSLELSWSHWLKTNRPLLSKNSDEDPSKI